MRRADARGQGLAQRTSGVHGAIRKTVGVRCIARFPQVSLPVYPRGRGEVPARHVEYAEKYSGQEDDGWGGSLREQDSPAEKMTATVAAGDTDH